MTTRKAMQSFTHALDRRYLVTHGTLRRQRRDAALRPIRFPAGVLKALAACKKPMSFNDTQVFRKLYPENDYPTSSSPLRSWKEDAEHMQMIERHHSAGELSDGLYVEIKNLLPITYADAAAIAKRANEERRGGASLEEIHDCLAKLEGHGDAELPQSADMQIEPIKPDDVDSFLMAAQATFLRWHLIRGYDWAFARGALLRLLRMARNEWRQR